MYSIEQIILRLVIFIIPAYLANSAPVLLGGHYPIDKGLRFFDKKPIFGPGKTWYGLFAGLSAGILGSVLLAYFLPSTQFDIWAAKPEHYILNGIALSLGALFGDLSGSFLKRRTGSKSGSQSEMLDQLGFLAGALLFVYLAGVRFVFTPFNLLFLAVLTYFIHKAANVFAYLYGLKRVPW
jgi:CDP-2,3-bis-(O-geranylgeranyl)-sn-glycerol synthase